MTIVSPKYLCSFLSHNFSQTENAFLFCIMIFLYTECVLTLYLYTVTNCTCKLFFSWLYNKQSDLLLFSSQSIYLLILYIVAVEKTVTCRKRTTQKWSNTKNVLTDNKEISLLSSAIFAHNQLIYSYCTKHVFSDFFHCVLLLVR